MYVKEQTDLRGAPSMPVPVTAIYLAVMVRTLHRRHLFAASLAARPHFSVVLLNQLTVELMRVVIEPSPQPASACTLVHMPACRLLPPFLHIVLAAITGCRVTHSVGASTHYTAW